MARLVNLLLVLKPLVTCSRLLQVFMYFMIVNVQMFDRSNKRNAFNGSFLPNHRQ